MVSCTTISNMLGLFVFIYMCWQARVRQTLNKILKQIQQKQNGSSSNNIVHPVFMCNRAPNLLSFKGVPSPPS